MDFHVANAHRAVGLRGEVDVEGIGLLTAGGGEGDTVPLIRQALSGEGGDVGQDVASSVGDSDGGGAGDVVVDVLVDP